MKRFTPDTIKYIKYLSMPDMHPEGEKTVFVKTEAEEEKGTFVPHIFELDHSLGAIKPAVLSTGREKRPLYSPDGKYLSYLSENKECKESEAVLKDDEFQIYIRKEGQAEGVQLTTLRHGITYYDWSYDSSFLVYTTPLWKKDLEENKEFIQMGTEEKLEWQKEREWAPVEITEIDYKQDECYGVRAGSITRIGLVDIRTKKQWLLPIGKIPFGKIPAGEMECAYPSFSRDGKKIAFFGKPYGGAFASASEIFVYDMKENSLKQVTKERSLMLFPSVRPLFSEDGSRLYVNAYYTGENGGCAETIYEVDILTGKATLFFDKEDESVTFGINSMAVGRTVYGEDKPYFVVDYEEGYLYFKNAWYGWENLYRASLKDSAHLKKDGPGENLQELKPKRELKALLTGQLNVQSFCLPRKGKLMLLGGNLQTIGELHELDIKSKQLRRRTFSNEWMKDYALAKTEELWVPTKDKKSKIQVWIVHPVEEEQGKRYPVVLDIHGGPECTYVSDFWHEFQALAEAGFVCVYTNPRGSVGYGLNFSGNDYAWREEAIDDLMQALDVAIEKGMADPERIGITGGSYGGYMTLKMITQTTRFKAAAAQRCLSNMATSYGTGDMGFLSRGSENVSKIKMLKVLTDRARKSHIRNVDKIKIPLLLLHGYKDYRCTFEQSEQMFIAMKERNPEIPVRLVMFPEENHGITRTGKLHNQIRHLQEMIDWFCKYLKEEQGND